MLSKPVHGASAAGSASRERAHDSVPVSNPQLPLRPVFFHTAIEPAGRSVPPTLAEGPATPPVTVTPQGEYGARSRVGVPESCGGTAGAHAGQSRPTSAPIGN